MEEKIECINTLLKAFESRNELLNEEIKKNEDAMEDLQEELNSIIETDSEELENEMVF